MQRAILEIRRAQQTLKQGAVGVSLVISVEVKGRYILLRNSMQRLEMLLKVADVYDDEVDNTVAGLTSLLEPIMIVFLAVVVGTIVIALFLPLISIITNLQGAS